MRTYTPTLQQCFGMSDKNKTRAYLLYSSLIQDGILPHQLAAEVARILSEFNATVVAQ